jgi:hypothetical protein
VGRRFPSTIRVSDFILVAISSSSHNVFATLRVVGPDTVQFILEHTGTRAVVCARRNLPQLCEAKSSNTCPHFRVAILVDGVTPDATRQASTCGLEVVSLAKVEAVGSEVLATTGHRHAPPTYDDVATFSYTSGTTGTPKGALLTHGNMVSAMAGFSIYGDMVLCITDRHLSYLPLPHIFERSVMSQVLAAGASAAFYRGDPTLLIEDLQACRPTILPAAPRVLNKIYDKVRHVEHHALKISLNINCCLGGIDLEWHLRGWGLEKETFRCRSRRKNPRLAGWPLDARHLRSPSLQQNQESSWPGLHPIDDKWFGAAGREGDDVFSLHAGCSGRRRQVVFDTLSSSKPCHAHARAFL